MERGTCGKTVTDIYTLRRFPGMEISCDVDYLYGCIRALMHSRCTRGAYSSPRRNSSNLRPVVGKSRMAPDAELHIAEGETQGCLLAIWCKLVGEVGALITQEF